ncbi:MAG: carbohydrate binding domain-containing protein [Planctomycetaceae bacterium]|nr:carbohydrate binding domain-containing protein [Planctomycetaceae bacterium]
MAIDYQDLFTNIGKCVKHINLYALYPSLSFDTHFNEIRESFEAQDIVEPIQGLLGDYTSLKQALVSIQESLARIADARLLDRTSILNELDTDLTDRDSIVAELIRQMVSDSESVDASTVTVGTVTAASGNVGTGNVAVTLLMDGVTSPASGVAAHPKYAGVTSELACAETITIVCIADSHTDGLTAGQEQFAIHGEVLNQGPFDYRSEGSGSGPTIQTVDVSTVITNGDFETFTVANTPDSWTLSGTAGTHIFSDATAGNFHRGAKALKFTGNGVVPNISVSQDISDAGLTPLRGYVLSFWMKGSASIADGDVTVQVFNDLSAMGSKTIAAASIPTTWTHYTAFFVTPATTLVSPYVQLLWDAGGGTITNAKSVWFDDVRIAEVPWHGGVGIIASAGGTDFVRGDRFTFTLANNGAGVFQEFTRKWWRAQLPSNTGGTETIADSLAT